RPKITRPGCPINHGSKRRTHPGRTMTIHSSAQPDTRRVVLIGAESTGKTTLATHLAAHYRTAWLPEYVRQFVEAKGASPVAEDVPAIARGHLAAARAAE